MKEKLMKYSFKKYFFCGLLQIYTYVLGDTKEVIEVSETSN